MTLTSSTFSKPAPAKDAPRRPGAKVAAATPATAAGEPWAHEPQLYDGILLASFGGPEGQDDVLPFLRNVTSGRGIPDARLEEVAVHYRAHGGVSPINAQNRALKAALEAELARRGLNLPVYWGNRNWAPYLTEAVTTAHNAGATKLLALATSAYASYSSCRQYREDFADALAATGLFGLVDIDKVAQFFDHPGFVAPFVTGLVEAVASLRAEGIDPADIEVLFTTHSVPTTDANRSGPRAGDPVLRDAEQDAAPGGCCGGGAGPGADAGAAAESAAEAGAAAEDAVPATSTCCGGLAAEPAVGAASEGTASAGCCCEAAPTPAATVSPALNAHATDPANPAPNAHTTNPTNPAPNTHTTNPTNPAPNTHPTDPANPAAASCCAAATTQSAPGQPEPGQPAPEQSASDAAATASGCCGTAATATTAAPASRQPLPAPDASPYGEGGAYAAQHHAVAEVVAAQAGQRLGGLELRWQLVYQSRSGPASQPWLEPDINDVIEALPAQGRRAVVVVPIGFISDHMEVLWDLDHEAAETAQDAGLAFRRTPTPGVHPDFVAGLVDLIEERLRGTARVDRERLTPLGPWFDVCRAGCCENARLGFRPAVAGIAP